MKADPTVQRRLVDIAELDLRLGSLAHRRRSLPEQAVVDALEAERRAAVESAARAGIHVEDLDRAIAKLRSDLEAVRRRRENDSGLVAAGGLSDRQATELEYELGSLHRREEALASELAELTERHEAVEADVRHSGATITDLDARLGMARTVRDTALADLEDAVTATTAERAREAEDLPPELLDLYSRSAVEAGVGAAILNGGRCSGCAMDLDRSTVSAFRSAPVDEVLTCPECGVIVVRTDNT
ncbi:zinc ribbon domain-containing protein [Dietzia sp. PP-33]|mgnify:CR=1 FL=1|jgi:predicted  nucleic acid-binding Zn-ribbon protein|uniref:zinc ribbon domain-containing protein n=1 Tax=Dietzia sp. PP-33 TaxID=2957500 RepID=UPI0029A23A45|nr:C4-type zinc ribbon domain-containing protein [Dietzia sp. PP-33]MDX2357457.1 C4-type zinc ribbon domain-containing protein [Dietzia sp. PP-33]